jgi:hypothetical protein
MEQNAETNVSQDLDTLIRNIKSGAGPEMTDKIKYYVLALLTAAQKLLSEDTVPAKSPGAPSQPRAPGPEGPGFSRRPW